MGNVNKVLMITTPLGEGHNSVARAISNYFESCNVECTTLDLYEYINPVLKEIMSKGYILSMKSAAMMKQFASDIYDISDKKEISSNYSLSHFTNELLASEIKEYITTSKPDIIICTQVFAAQVVDILKEKKIITAKTVGIITDFTIQKYWEDTEYFDYIVVPNEQLDYQIRRRGIDTKRALPLGIPIDLKFSRKTNKNEAKKELGLEVDKSTVLVMGGGMGFGHMEKYISELDESTLNFQIVAICGTNEKLYKKIKRMETKKNCILMGYVENVDLIMDASDCIISKPGGITTSESLAKGLPLIIVNPLPGVEDRNVEFLMNNGAAIVTSKTFSITEALELLFKYPDRLFRLKTSIEAIAKPNATKELCDFLLRNQ